MNIILRIKKKLKSIYYYLMTDRNLYGVYKKLDVLLIYLEEVGIKEYFENDEFYATIIFNDDTEFLFWNTNKYHAWMNRGRIRFSNGKLLKWDKKMPSAEVIYKFFKIIQKYEKVGKIEDNDYSEYLPIKTLRKIKLKKLK